MPQQTSNQKTFLCISCEYKGLDFIRTCHKLGHRVFLVTAEKTRDMGWPFECIADTFYMPDEDGRIWDMNTLIQGTAFLMRGNHIDRVIALDDYDVNKVAWLREEFRLPGMGQTTARHFYDKLAMRMQAADANIPVPAFSALFEDAEVDRFLNEIPAPWLVKPRSDAGALGIRKLHSKEEALNHIASLRDNRYKYLIESFEPGNVYHVDCLTFEDKALFTRCSGYRKPPFEVAHGGGIFSSATLELSDEENGRLIEINKKVLSAFGMRHGASHTEYIKSHSDGKFYFLETSARVGGAHLADMVEAASGVSLWSEWAKIEIALMEGKKYKAPKDSGLMAGIIVSLSHEEKPDYASYAHPSLAWTLSKDFHVGLIYRNDKLDEVHSLLDGAGERIKAELHASMPLKE